MVLCLLLLYPYLSAGPSGSTEVLESAAIVSSSVSPTGTSPLGSASAATLDGIDDWYVIETGQDEPQNGPAMLKCADVSTVGGAMQTCCELPPKLGRGGVALAGGEGAGAGAARMTVSCFPSVVIGGAQKSGSTALSALLLQHPNVRFADRKEVHYFSTIKAFSKGLVSYLRHFSLSVARGTEARLDRFVTAEATPFYIASASSCKYMSQTIPSVKVIFLLRDPVARAYSEYQMKVRRIEEAGELAEVLLRYRGPFVSCLLRYALESRDAVKRCVPDAMSEMAKWRGSADKVLKRLGVPANGAAQKSKAKASAFAKTAGKCFIRDEASSFSSITSMDILEALPPEHRRLADAAALDAPRPDLDHGQTSIEDAPDDAMSAVDAEAIPWKHAPQLQPGRYLTGDGAAMLNGTAPRRLWAEGERGAHGARDADEGGSGKAKAKERVDPLATINVGSVTIEKENGEGDAVVPELGGIRVNFSPGCLRFLNEKVPDLESAMRTEMKDLRSCMATANGGAQPTTAEAALLAVESCTKPSPGITRQFIYRSLYAPQLQRCFRDMPRSQVLVLRSEELKSDVESAMRRVHSFTGLPHFDYAARTSEELNAVFEEAYPDFQDRTGWRMTSAYEPMPDDLREEMMLFFKPFNDMLVDMGFGFAAAWNA